MKCPTCQSDNIAGVQVCSSCGTPLNNTFSNNSEHVPLNISLPRGTSLQNGAFKVASVLGQGGFGITYKGGDMNLKRYVAIKEFFPQGCIRNTTQVQPTSGVTKANFGEGKTKFLEEARTLARFNHPNIVRVFASFEENNTAYMVMEMLEGKSLQSILDEKGVVPEKTAVTIVTQIGEALSIVHKEGLLHRDIKPDNIILNKNNRAVLIDFGTAREYTAGKTRSMTAMLTPGYAPLEQWGSQAKYGPYTDVYALAATLYHCLTGQLPTIATDRAMGAELPSPDVINPNVSPTLCRVVLWAMDMDVNKRPKNIEIFLDALQGKIPPSNRMLTLNNPQFRNHRGDNRITTNADLESLLQYVRNALRTQDCDSIRFNKDRMEFRGIIPKTQSVITVLLLKSPDGNQAIINCGTVRFKRDVMRSMCITLHGRGFTADTDLYGEDAQKNSIHHRESPEFSSLDQWYCFVNDQKLGPMSQEAVIKMSLSGQVNRNTLVWRSGMIDWEELRWTELIVRLNQVMPS